MTVPKIRAWDSETCLMVPDYCLERSAKGHIYAVISPSTETRVAVAKAFPPNHVMQSFHVFDNSEEPKEIYEGDVVEFEDCNSEYEDTFMSIGIVERSDLGLNITNRYTVEVEDLLLGDYQLDVKVVGNIYQNKDLLEKLK
jgi:yopX protein